MAALLPLDAEPPAVAVTAFGAALAQARQRAGRTLLFVLTLCGGIALLLTALDGHGFGIKLVYSLCVGLFCTVCLEGGRLSMAAGFDALRRWRGLSLSDSGFHSGWRGMLMAAPVAALAGPALGLALADRLLGFESPSLLQLSAASSRTSLVLAALGTAISVFVLGTMERLTHARAQAEAAQRLAAESQLRLLQSQLEPHMLFNTLANLRVLIGLDAVRAQMMLDRLIAFLRASLSASRSRAHPLADEFRHLDDYLALMAIRMGPRLSVRLTLPPALAGLPVPPLLLQPLVENAIKHGLEPKVEGGRIDIEAERQGPLLILRVRDTGLGLACAAPTAGSSFGLEQVRSRLRTVYGAQATLQLQDAPGAQGGALATLQLPLEGP
jgi:hypothetical protein